MTAVRPSLFDNKLTICIWLFINILTKYSRILQNTLRLTKYSQFSSTTHGSYQILLALTKQSSLLLNTFTSYCGQGSSVDMATDYGLDGLGSNPSRDEVIRPSIPALVPIQPPVKWVLCLSWG
jgi:hypothetical protein